MRKLRHSISGSLNFFFAPRSACPFCRSPKEITYTVSTGVMNGARDSKRSNNESFPDRPSRVLWTCNLEKKILKNQTLNDR
ncbi:Uncharacterized protein FWK35_00034459 [Aphis craccivora]|uniref:Uncharacterized protein n=1 Tax=Aphis craccivora TaxID=307492 RepID=A0A6G0YJ76_APHCR|nr:Uncharacterized protein FWK35_00034459 [Aphis craccivora]